MQLRSKLLALCAALCLSALGAGPTQAWPTIALPAKASQPSRTAAGLVTGVADGDTCYVMIDGKSTRVRLAEIDAPEKAQAFGRRSEQSLRELVGQREVTLTWSTVDRYERPIVHILASGVDVNAEQVRRGYAWVYRQYSKDPALLDLEREAREAKRGLWADAHPVEPWAWRHNQKPQHGE